MNFAFETTASWPFVCVACCHASVGQKPQPCFFLVQTIPSKNLARSFGHLHPFSESHVTSSEMILNVAIVWRNVLHSVAWWMDGLPWMTVLHVFCDICRRIVHQQGSLQLDTQCLFLQLLHNFFISTSGSVSAVFGCWKTLEKKTTTTSLCPQMLSWILSIDPCVCCAWFVNPQDNKRTFWNSQNWQFVPVVLLCHLVATSCDCWVCLCPWNQLLLVATW